MDKSQKKGNISKIYCEKCDSIFESRNKYDEHFSKHSSGVYCELCPIDTVVQKLANLFKRAK